MGTINEVFVGPFILVPKLVEKVRRPKRTQCLVSVNHAPQPYHKFCPECGGKVETEFVDSVVYSPVTPDREKFVAYCKKFWVPESCFNVDGYALWLPTEARNSYADRMDCMLFVTTEMVESTEKFQLENQSMIDELKDLVKSECLVKFGVVKYWY